MLQHFAVKQYSTFQYYHRAITDRLLELYLSGVISYRVCFDLGRFQRDGPENPSLFTSDTSIMDTILLLPYVVKAKRVLVLSPLQRMSEQIWEQIGSPTFKEYFGERGVVPKSQSPDFLPHVKRINKLDQLQCPSTLQFELILAHLQRNGKGVVIEDFDPQSFDYVIVNRGDRFRNEELTKISEHFSPSCKVVVLSKDSRE